jgi:regulator of CtrA degradation
MNSQVTFGGNDRPVSFAHKLASSPAFMNLFREGMALVEESAGYLDGKGRDESKALPRLTALAYASESMRLTTRLMQLASWLLLQRAVNEGEMSQVQAATEKHRVRLSRQDFASAAEVFEKLPERLKDLSLRSMRLQERIMHFDQLITRQTVDTFANEAPRPVESQLEQLRMAFGVNNT